jgi:2-succinyl-5-enolpyruvyl-6-hydroxy-3-cyclohexene-1-carboxylate synthase
MTEGSSYELAKSVVDELAQGGVTEACIAPGSRSAPLAMALHDDDRIRLHVRIDERSASFLALGIGKASGNPALVVSTSGTAAANFHPAVLEAHHGRVPLIVLTADRPPELRGTGANQTIDQTKLFGDAVRFWSEVGPETDIKGVRFARFIAAQACEIVRVAPRGPAHLNVAFREPLVPDESIRSDGDGGRLETRPTHRTIGHSNHLSDPAMEGIAGQINSTTRGLIVAGDADFDLAPVLALAQVTGWPVLAEPQSGLRSSPSAISTYDALLRCPVWAAGHRPDFVLRVGKMGLSKNLLAWLDSDIEQMLIDEHPEELDPTRSIRTFVRANPGALAEQLSKSVAERGSTTWTDEWITAEKQARSVIDELLDSHEEPTEPRIARDLSDLLPAGSTLVAASSMPVRDVDSFMRAGKPIRVLANRGVSGIDGFVSTSIGIALAGHRRVAALAGDLSMIHDAGGLATLEGPTPDLVFVVVNNDGGGIFSFLPQAKWTESFDRLFGTPHGLDFGRLAELYGCGYARLESATQLKPALADARSYGGIFLIEARTDRTENHALHLDIWSAVRRTLGEQA